MFDDRVVVVAAARLISAPSKSPVADAAGKEAS
jgi:hypothetical protein